MNSWWYRMKPRSIIKTIEWFRYFADLEGKDWNLIDPIRKSSIGNRSIFINRRKYIFAAHGEDLAMTLEDLLSGKFDTNEIESQARNDKTTFEFFGFGYVDKHNIIRVTDFGRLIIENEISGELLLKQLLKIQFPRPGINPFVSNKYIFPLQIFLNILNKFEYLYYGEIAFIFGCIDFDRINQTERGIAEFRSRFLKLNDKERLLEFNNLFHDIFSKTYPDIDNSSDTYLDYTDAFVRSLLYTGLFQVKGRGKFRKVYIPEQSKVKVSLISENYDFKINKTNSLEIFMEYFGNIESNTLPWENVEDRKRLIRDKVKIYSGLINSNKTDEYVRLSEIENLLGKKDTNLLLLDEELSNKIRYINEEKYITITSKTKEARLDIIDKFHEIDNGNEDLASLWLEVNTWKSLVAIKGNHKVKRNFKIEDDLTPKSFAPGIGNTPDMELYNDNFVLIPEVSLMSGVKQWQHEGSSVIDHVLKFIDISPKKEVYGLFLTKKLNNRTLWQFFALNKESWMGNPVPVIPLTIKQYIDILEFIYEFNLDINSLLILVGIIHRDAKMSPSFRVWRENLPQVIQFWKELNRFKS